MCRLCAVSCGRASGAEMCIRESAETEQWIERISEAMESEPFCKYQSVESGARSWKWRKGDTAASLYRMMDDILTVSFQPAVGELS